MRAVVTLFISLFVSLSVFAQDVWTLEQCIDHALQNNISVKQSELNRDVTKLTSLQNQLSLLPGVNASGNQSWNRGRAIDPTTNLFETRDIKANSFNLQSGITVFNGFTRINTVRQGRYDYEASKEDLEAMKNDISLAVASSYLQILFNKELVKLADEQLNVSDEQLGRTERLVEAGALPMGDLLQVKAQVETDKLNRINAVNNLDISLLNLMILLQLDLSKKIDIVTPELNVPLEAAGDSSSAEQIYRAAEATQPVIKSVELKRKSFKTALQIARGAQIPSISAFGNLGTNYSDAAQRVSGIVDNGFPVIGYDISSNPVTSAFPDLDFMFEETPFSDQIDENFQQTYGLSISIPIFNAGARRIAIQKAKIGLQSADLNIKQAKQTLMTDVYTAHSDANAAGQRYLAAVESVGALQEANTYTRRKYDEGLVNFFEFSTSNNNLLRAQSELLQAKFEYIFKLKILDFYQGKPITLN